MTELGSIATLRLESDKDSGKLCARCHRYYPLDMFNRKSEDKTKHQSYCRKCQHEYAAEHYVARGRTAEVVDIISKDVQRREYESLFESYKTFASKLDEYILKYGEVGLSERLRMEYEMGY